jgi:hypothetical protein
LSKSIQVFRYKLCPSKAEVRITIGIKKIIPRKVRDKRTKDEKLLLKTTFSKIHETDDGIGGTITHEIQQKTPHSKDEYQIWDPSIEFFIVPELQIIILDGAKTIRDKVLDIIESILSKDSDSVIEIINIPKDKLDKLVDKIRVENIRNRVAWHKNKSDRINDNEGIEDHAYNMHKGKCVTNIKRFEKEKEIATSYDCKLGLVKCSGIIDDEVKDEVLLKITSKAELGFSNELESKHWNRFILERFKIVL